MIPRIRRMKTRAGPARTGTPAAPAQTTYPSIGHAMLLHGEQLIYSTLPLGATKALHRFLVATFLAPHPLRTVLVDPSDVEGAGPLRAALRRRAHRARDSRAENLREHRLLALAGSLSSVRRAARRRRRAGVSSAVWAR